MKISSQTRFLIKQALREDIGRGDVTSQTFIRSNLIGDATIYARATGIMCGGPVIKEVFHALDRRLKVAQMVREGSRISNGRKLFVVRGRVRSILKAERVALNFLGHLSGIATVTNKYVSKTKGTKAKIYDTRKTTPLWREIEKYAVRIGGGENHRFGLWDEVLVKDNHWHAMHKLLVSTRCRYFGERLRPLLRRQRIPVEIEVRSFGEVSHLLEGTLPIDRVLLDHFSLGDLRRTVSYVRKIFQQDGRRSKRPLLEASGNIHLRDVRKVAQTGVDRISVGALTHSAPSFDVSLTVGRVSGR